MFAALANPTRRDVLDLLLAGPQPVSQIAARFDMARPSVSEHLKVLRDAGFATVRAEGARRLYAMDAAPMTEVDAWLDRFRGFWTPKLEALATEVARGKRKRRGA